MHDKLAECENMHSCFVQSNLPEIISQALPLPCYLFLLFFLGRYILVMNTGKKKKEKKKRKNLKSYLGGWSVRKPRGLAAGVIGALAAYSLALSKKQVAHSEIMLPSS